MSSEVTSKIEMKEPNKFIKFINSKKLVPYIFVSPFLISFLVLTLYPVIKGITMSFQEVLPGQVSFVVLEYYSRLFNTTFYKSMSNTMLYVIFTVIIMTFVQIIL